MLAAFATSISRDDPLSGLEVGERNEPTPSEGWARVAVKAASLNHHDLWSLRGVGLTADRLPMTLGCDAAGIDEATGEAVIVHSVINDPPVMGLDETMHPGRTLLSELYDGTLAEYVVVPRRNLVPKPADLTWEEAACLPTAWLTAYRMLFTRSGAEPGSTILIQGAGGGVSTALIALAHATGYRVWVTGREESKRARALELGADAVFEPGARLPERVDAVMETVGAATWEHSLKALRPGGTVVVSGATSGPNPPADLARVFFLQLSVVGSTMGTLDELHRLAQLCSSTGIRPLIDAVHPLADARAAFERLASGDVFGKIVLTV